ncbi:MAG: saccharopine dehydrogenase NADP-binding domain-containing protein [Acidobacteria bacterium]|nr:saccharopine dehydrogenase NADP-binding domain-containing protein [Acidobacteriota bacterium]
MKRIAVLGCGLIGATIVRDLANDSEFAVRAVDVSEKALDGLAEHVERQQADLSDQNEIRRVIANADVVVGAVPGRFGQAMLRTVIEAGKPISDISFAPENPLELDELAKEQRIAAVVDAGVSPGLSNLAVGRGDALLDVVEQATILVGGLPVPRYWPYEYRSVFSPTDVIEEYTRPARLVENERVVTREALSEVEMIDFDGIGTLEAFNTDGLRTLLDTVRAVNMKEKTLRYPGHVDRMRMMREAGFFSDEPVNVDGTEVVPRRLTETLMFSQWQRPANEEELTVLRVDVAGSSGGKARSYRFDLLDRTDLETGTSSMARTTGFPCAIIAGLLARGEIGTSGVLPLEILGRDERLYERIIAELERRGVKLEMRELI